MGRFLDFITGGNPKVSANLLADMHYKLGGNFADVYSIVFMVICRSNPKNHAFFDYFLENRVPNYSVMGAIQLNATAAPLGVPIQQTIFDFEPKIARHLRARSIPEIYVSGNNASITRAVAQDLKRM